MCSCSVHLQRDHDQFVFRLRYITCRYNCGGRLRQQRNALQCFVLWLLLQSLQPVSKTPHTHSRTKLYSRCFSVRLNKFLYKGMLFHYFCDRSVCILQPVRLVADTASLQACVTVTCQSVCPSVLVSVCLYVCLAGMKPKVRDHYHAHRLSIWNRLIPKLHRAGAGGAALSRDHHLLEDFDNQVSVLPNTSSPFKSQILPILQTIVTIPNRLRRG